MCCNVEESAQLCNRFTCDCAHVTKSSAVMSKHKSVSFASVAVSISVSISVPVALSVCLWFVFGRKSKREEE